MMGTAQPDALRASDAGGLDLLRLPGVGALLKSRWGRLALQVPLGLLALLLVLHGFFGPQLAPKNLATLLTWVHYRGVLVLALLAVGNLFCMACPLLLPRELARRFVQPTRSFPRVLRNKWLATGLFVALLFAYEAWDLWQAPVWTAALILGYFVLAFLVDVFFKRGAFCKYVCPIGQFNFVSSTVSPFEVRARDLATCATCETADCIRGRRDPEEPARVVHRGCELDLYLPRKVGNLDCTFCMDCAVACPHDNVALATRMPAEELGEDPLRSGIGRLSRRPDFAVLTTVFVFGALLNAFAMVSPAYAFQTWMAGELGTRSEAFVLAALFVLVLVVEPVLLMLLAGAASRGFARAGGSLLQNVTRFAYGLAPLGVGVWAAHYAFHFLTGLWTFVPVAQAAAADVGIPLGTPDWGRGGLTASAVQPIELGLLVLGLAGSFVATLGIARREVPSAPGRAATPWVVLHVVLFAAAVWILSQPMEMRGTFL